MYGLIEISADILNFERFIISACDLKTIEYENKNNREIPDSLSDRR